MKGPRIDYDLVKEVMKAAGGTTSPNGNAERIEIVIPPKGAKDEAIDIKKPDEQVQVPASAPADTSSTAAPSTSPQN